MTPAKNGTGRYKFAVGDRVRFLWLDGYRRATVTSLHDEFGTRIQFDGEEGGWWVDPKGIEALDAVSRLGDVLREGQR